MKTPLHDAAKKGDSAAIRDILKNEKAQKNAQGLLKRVFGYISNYFKVKLIDQQDKVGNTALHYAAFDNRLEAASCLILEGKANITLKNNFGYTPLQVAQMSRHV